MTESGSGRKQLILLALIFFLPLLFAWLMYFGVIKWRPDGVAASGTLVHPAVPLPEHEPVYLQHDQSPEFLRGQWYLVFVAPATCKSDCEESLLLMRQVRLALGKYQERIGRLFIVDSKMQWTDAMRGAFPAMEVVQKDAFTETVLKSGGKAPGEAIYLVDPLGNLMMRFNKNHDPREMHDDMKRVLKLSRIG